MLFLFTPAQDASDGDVHDHYFGESGLFAKCCGLEIEDASQVGCFVLRPINADGAPSPNCYIEIPSDPKMLAKLADFLSQNANSQHPRMIERRAHQTQQRTA